VFEPHHPDHGSLAHVVEQPVEARQNPIRARGEPPCRTNTMASVPAFQAGNAGSIPACGSERCKHDG
jgi:hypothetical protein